MTLFIHHAAILLFTSVPYLFTTDCIMTSQLSGSFLQNGIIHILWGLPMKFLLHNEVEFPFSIPYLIASILWCTVLPINPSFPNKVARHTLSHFFLKIPPADLLYKSGSLPVLTLLQTWCWCCFSLFRHHLN